MNIQLMTDSGADIPKSIQQSLQIKVVPLYLHFHDEQFKVGVDLDLNGFYQKVREKKELPRSAAPSPNDYYEAYKEIDPDTPILMISISKGLSSTYENAIAGKNMLLEEEPNRTIEVINSKTASPGMLLLLYETGLKLKEGYSFEQLVQHIKDCVNKTKTLFVLKTLDNLILGGRLDKMKGTLAKTLNIKLLMQGSKDGTIEVTEKVRGEKKSLRRFIEQIGEHTKNTENKILAMTYCRDESRAKAILHEIQQKYNFKETLLTETGPLISTYGGEGALVIAFFQD